MLMCPHSPGLGRRESGLVWARWWLSRAGTGTVRVGVAPAGGAPGPAWRTWLSGPPGNLQNVPRPSASLHCLLPGLVFWSGCELRFLSSLPGLRTRRRLLRSSGLPGSPLAHKTQGQRMALQALEGSLMAEVVRVPPFPLLDAACPGNAGISARCKKRLVMTEPSERKKFQF